MFFFNWCCPSVRTGSIRSCLLQLEEWPIFRKAARRVDELKVKREAVFGVMEEDEEGGEGV